MIQIMLIGGLLLLRVLDRSGRRARPEAARHGHAGLGWGISFAMWITLLVSSTAWAVEGGHPEGRPLRHVATEVTRIADGVSERVFDLHFKTAIRQRILYVAPPSPRATIVMLPGGTGNLGLMLDGNMRHDENFVVRTRGMWAAKGYAVVIPDTIDRANLRGARSSPEYASVVEDLVQFAHARASGAVFLLGTSQGSIAAANGAAHAHLGTLAGVVLTESVSRLGGSHETVFDADLDDIRTPALVVANRDDRCDVAPPQDAPEIARAMTHAPDVRVLKVSGGMDVSSNRCGSLSPHGYYGIETQVLGEISNWMRDHLH
jgi:hypothetical protein